MTLVVPEHLAAPCRKTPERLVWLEQLPAVIHELRDRWALALEAPFDGPEVSAAWVAPATGVDGTRAVLKLAMPHLEGGHEIQGLRFWNGDPTVRLLEADDDRNALLLERCDPGTPLRELPEPEQDVIIAGLLRRIRRPLVEPHPFRSLAVMTSRWADETLADSARWPDAGMVRAGLRLLRELPETATTYVLLATDLHAGNVLRARREPWLVIDPKPFVGDPAYDATQHLLNCRRRLRTDPFGTIRRFAELAGIDEERARLWTFARAAAEPRENWDDDSLALARVLA